MGKDRISDLGLAAVTGVAAIVVTVSALFLPGAEWARPAGHALALAMAFMAGGFWVMHKRQPSR